MLFRLYVTFHDLKCSHSTFDHFLPAESTLSDVAKEKHIRGVRLLDMMFASWDR